jgi:hypothetical protein
VTDIAVSERDEVLNCQAQPQNVVGRDRRHPRSGFGTVHKDRRHAGIDAKSDGGIVPTRRREHQALDAACHQALDDRDLLLRVGTGIGHQ